MSTIVFMNGANVIRSVGRFRSQVKAVTVAEYLLETQPYAGLTYVIVPYIMTATEDYK